MMVPIWKQRMGTVAAKHPSLGLCYCGAWFTQSQRDAEEYRPPVCSGCLDQQDHRYYGTDGMRSGAYGQDALEDLSLADLLRIEADEKRSVLA